MKKRPRRLRLLIIEDDVTRVERFRSWLPTDVLTVVAASAGRAIGILERDRGAVYAGILLDHDLTEQAFSGVDDHLSGTQVADVIIRNIEPGTPILVHSMNASESPRMATRLDAAGFPVTKLPMKGLDAPKLLAWLEEVRALFHDEESE